MAGHLRSSDARISSMSERHFVHRFMRALALAAGIVVVLSLASGCEAQISVNATQNDIDLLNGINVYRGNISLPPLDMNPGGQCLASRLASYYRTTACTNTTAQYSVPDSSTYTGYDESIQYCRILPQNVEDAKILPVCVDDALVASALPFYTTSQQVGYQAAINSSLYVSAGISSAGDYFFVILGTAGASGSLGQNAVPNLAEGSTSFSLLFVLKQFILGLVAFYCSTGGEF